MESTKVANPSVIKRECFKSIDAFEKSIMECLAKHYLRNRCLKDDDGNPLHKKVLKIGILGGGIGGLYTALILDSMINKGYENIQYEIIEATDRIGGRIITKHLDPNFPDQYFDMGAMRLPTLHTPVFDLIAYVNELIDANNQNPKKSHINKLVLRDYFMDSRRAGCNNLFDKSARDHSIFYDKASGIYFQRKDIEEKELPPDTPPEKAHKIKEAKELEQRYIAMTARAQEELISALQSSVKQDSKVLNYEDLLNSKEFLDFHNKYQHYTFLSFIMEEQVIGGKKYSFKYEEAVKLETYFYNSNILANGMIEILIDDLNFNSNLSAGGNGIWRLKPPAGVPDDENRRFFTITNGVEELPRAIYQLLGRQKFILNTEAYLVKNAKCGVKVFTRTRGVEGHEIRKYDKIMVALPSACCFNIDWKHFKDDLSEILEGFRVINYHQLFKMSLQFKHRFWEDTTLLKEGLACIGGQCYTDLASRWFVFPCYGYENGPANFGVLANYNWNGDAIRWAGMSDEQRVERALSDLQELYDKLKKDCTRLNVRDYYTGSFSVQSWVATPANGCAMFNPYQFKNIVRIAQGIDNKVFFSGEHLSVHHAWILGAVQSAAMSTSLMLGKKVTFLSPTEKSGPEDPSKAKKLIKK